MAKILVVDDDPQICEQLTEILTNYGHAVNYLNSGEEALKVKEEYDVVLMDLVMPKVDGLYLLSHFKRAMPNTRVIMITAFATIESAVEAMRRGATDYVSKPFRSKQIETAIERAMEEARFMDRLKAQKEEKEAILESHEDDLQEVLNSLANPIRHGVLKLLKRHEKASFSEIRNELSIEDSPKLSFHLKKLSTSGLLKQDADRNYSLSEKGVKVVGMLDQMKSDMG